MKKLHIAVITVSGLVDARWAGRPRQPHRTADGAPIASGIEHHHSIDDFQPTVMSRGLHQRAPQWPLTLSSTQGHLKLGVPVACGRPALAPPLVVATGGLGGLLVRLVNRFGVGSGSWSR